MPITTFGTRIERIGNRSKAALEDMLAQGVLTFGDKQRIRNEGTWDNPDFRYYNKWPGRARAQSANILELIETEGLSIRAWSFEPYEEPTLESLLKQGEAAGTLISKGTKTK